MKSIVGIGLNQNALDTEGLYDVVYIRLLLLERVGYDIPAV